MKNLDYQSIAYQSKKEIVDHSSFNWTNDLNHSNSVRIGANAMLSSPENSINHRSLNLSNTIVRTSSTDQFSKSIKIDLKNSSHPSHVDHPRTKDDRISSSTSSEVRSFIAKILLLTSSIISKSQRSSHHWISFYLKLTILLTLLHTSSAASLNNSGRYNYVRFKRNLESESITKNQTDPIISSTTKRIPRDDRSDQLRVQISGFRIEGKRVEIEDDQITTLYSNNKYNILLYGINFRNYSSEPLLLSITPVQSNRGDDCSVYSKEVYNLTIISNIVAQAEIEFDSSDAEKSPYYYICIDYQSKSVHQGDENWLRIHVKNKALPLWLQIFFIFILLCLAGLFSGLNLGLMQLDMHELEVIECCGTATEKKYARRIKPVRKRGNYLLCTILLGNVMVQTTLTVLLEDLTSGLIAIMGSTFSIVVFGEIVPQAICSRQGLAIGANTVFLMWFFMFLTFPISFPISWALDRILGKEIGKIYDRDRLTEYLRITKEHNKLDQDELNIIQGALKLKKIRVDEIMTKLEDIFSLPKDSVLNFNTLTLIQRSGFSRIPVYEKDKSNIVAVLFAKDLAFVDPDDKVPIQTLCQYYQHEISFIFADTTCHTAFLQFKEGKSHMAFVKAVVESIEDKDPYYQVLGLVTLEDVLEEVLQTEIVDETDVLTDNRRMVRRKEVESRIDYAELCWLNSESHNVAVSPQMVLVSYQFLSTSVYAFSKRFISESVLRELINQNVYHKEDLSSCYSDKKTCKLYEKGKSYDYFILILEGYAQVSVSKENLVFQAGPFSVFGESTLKLTVDDNWTIESLENQKKEPFNWQADYTVEVVEKLTYLKLSRELYISTVMKSLEQKQNSQLETIENSISKNDVQNTFNGLKLKYNNDKKI